MLKRLIAGGGLVLVTLTGCESYPFLPGALDGGEVAGVTATFGIEPFAENVITARTFIGGRAVTTLTYEAGDATRSPWGIDFNGDGRIDPVAGYSQSPAPTGGIIQILLSSGTSSYTSLTLDGNNTWRNLLDVAVGDIDGDGAPDVVASTAGGVLYLRHPGPGLTTVLREWGAETPDQEFLAGSTESLTADELEAIIQDLLPPGANALDYEASVEQGYTNVEIGDLDGDGAHDVVASRRLKVELQPRDGTAGEPVLLVTGSLQAFINPGGAQTGENWELVQIGRHERYADLDRQGAGDTKLYDMDGDGDLDIVSAAREDDNVAVSWFQNPGGVELFELAEWTPWRVGSVRDAYAIDIADVTGDGRVDVVATGSESRQMVLFEQPSSGPTRDYDWSSYVIVIFENYKPMDVKAFDLDRDGVTELVVGGDGGQIRWFEPSANPRNAWSGSRVTDVAGGGAVGLLSYGDLNGDGRIDLIAVADGGSDLDDQLLWIRSIR